LGEGERGGNKLQRLSQEGRSQLLAREKDSGGVREKKKKRRRTSFIYLEREIAAIATWTEKLVEKRCLDRPAKKNTLRTTLPRGWRKRGNKKALGKGGRVYAVEEEVDITALFLPDEEGYKAKKKKRLLTICMV